MAIASESNEVVEPRECYSFTLILSGFDELRQRLRTHCSTQVATTLFSAFTLDRHTFPLIVKPPH